MKFHKLYNLYDGDISLGFEVRVVGIPTIFLCNGRTHEDAISYFEEHFMKDEYKGENAFVQHHKYSKEDLKWLHKSC